MKLWSLPAEGVTNVEGEFNLAKLDAVILSTVAILLVVDYALGCL